MHFWNSLAKASKLRSSANRLLIGERPRQRSAFGYASCGCENAIGGGKITAHFLGFDERAASQFFSFPTGEGATGYKNRRSALSLISMPM
jgi:hypothetical protein